MSPIQQNVHLQVNQIQKVKLPLSGARSRRNRELETNIPYYMNGNFSNEDFTPSICNMKRNNSSTTSDPIGQADLSSYI